MDDDLRRLSRAARAEPADERTARDYDRALLRAGKADQAQRRFRMKFLCELSFDAMAPTSDPRVRDCGRCGKSVHMADDPSALAEHVAARRCVAITRAALPAGWDALVLDPRVHSAADPARACVVESPAPVVDLDVTSIPEAAADALPSEQARLLRVVPFRIDAGGALHVAVSGRVPPSLLDALRRLTGRQELELALSSEGAIERALERTYPEVEEGRYLLGVVEPFDASPSDEA
jgi:hypothetical protein